MTTSNLRIVVAGIAGSGKTTVGQHLASQLGIPYVDGDSIHPPTNIAKMAAGTPLTDDDRWPWLAAIKAELCKDSGVVISCSALKRTYRDLLRSPGGVRFVFLDISRDVAIERAAHRADHFMAPAMIDSQMTTLERPTPDETDVHLVSADETEDTVVAAALAAAALPLHSPSVDPILSVGNADTVISQRDLESHIDRLVRTEVLGTGTERVLLVPPDHTRLHSRAGEITGYIYERLVEAGCHVAVLPALGTHTEMTPDDVNLLFGDRVPYASILHHDWRDGLVHVGEITPAEVSLLSADRFSEPIPVDVDQILFEDWDLVISVGQVVPHEVIGMANYSKNLVIGLGGGNTVHRSHFLGAVSDMELIMGHTSSPVRDVVDAAFDRFLAPRIEVLWILTVMEDTSGGIVQRGLFAGRGRSSESGGAAYRAAARLAVECNIDTVDREFTRVACWLDPDEFRTTWLGNKAIYRTRMAIADDGELIILAPGVHGFGEHETIDALIRCHGYRGTPATLAAMETDPALAASLGAAAHLIHGSSEGRFRIVYCTDPNAGGLTRAEVEGVGFEWRSLAEEMRHLGVTSVTATGQRMDSEGRSFDFIANPALGLWASSHRIN